MGLQKNDKLNKLLVLLPEGVAAPSSWLANKGYSRQLVRKYVQGKWLVPLGRGVYAQPTVKVNWQGLVLGIQQLTELPFHVGGCFGTEPSGLCTLFAFGWREKTSPLGAGKGACLG